MRGVLGHGCVDLTGQFDEPRVLSVLPRLPREIKRIDRDAMPSKTRTGIERHETKGFGSGSLDHLPNIDPHRGIDHFEFVDQGYVDAAKRIFKQLARLRHATGRDRNYSFDRHRVERLGSFQTRRSITSHHFRYRRHLAVRITWILPLRRERQMKIDTGLETGPSLQYSTQVFVGRPRIGSGLQYHQDAPYEMRRDRFARLDDKRNVWFPVLIQRRGHTNDHSFDLFDPAEVVRSGKSLCLDRRHDRFRRDMFDVTSSLIQRFHLGAINLQA